MYAGDVNIINNKARTSMVFVGIILICLLDGISVKLHPLLLYFEKYIYILTCKYI